MSLFCILKMAEKLHFLRTCNSEVIDMNPYIVYVKLDEENRITSVDSSAFLRETDGWTEIDSGYGDKHHHAQGNYFDKPPCDERGIYRYKAYQFVDAPAGKIIARFFKNDEEYVILERTQEEMDADYVPPEVKPTDAERISKLESEKKLLTAQVQALSDRNDFMEDCIAEMATIVYA